MQALIRQVQNMSANDASDDEMSGENKEQETKQSVRVTTRSKVPQHTFTKQEILEGWGG